MRFNEITQRLLEKSEAFKKAYLREDIRIEISNLITAARIHKGLSQKELAKLAKTTQPNIARIESGKFLPSIHSLDRIAKAIDTHLIVKFAFMEDDKGTPPSLIQIPGIPYSLRSDPTTPTSEITMCSSKLISL